MTDATNNAAAALTPAEIGITPAGSEWVVYPKAGDTAATLAARAQAQGERLAALWTRHAAKVVTVKLTPAQLALALDASERMESSDAAATRAMGDAVTWTRSTLTASRQAMAELADRVGDPTEDEHREAVEGAAMDELSEARIEFGVRAKVRSQNAAEAALLAAAGDVQPLA